MPHAKQTPTTKLMSGRTMVVQSVASLGGIDHDQPILTAESARAARRAPTAPILTVAGALRLKIILQPFFTSLSRLTPPLTCGGRAGGRRHPRPCRPPPG